MELRRSLVGSYLVSLLLVWAILGCALPAASAASGAPAGPQAQPVTERLSRATGGAQENGPSSAPAFSGDSSRAVFVSGASNLVSGDTNGANDVFLRNRSARTTSRVSVASDGSQANAKSWAPAISADGWVVAFVSLASNLVPGDTNGVADVFVRDLATGTTIRVSWTSSDTQANGGSSAPALSSTGRYVAFVSVATNMVGGDTNGVSDVFVRDRVAHTTTRISVGATGTQGNGASSAPAMSGDAGIVAFTSLATNLVSGDTNGVADVFVRDRAAGTTIRVSWTSSGTQPNGASTTPSISGDGRFVAFGSLASNMTPGDVNGASDVFVRDRTAHTTARMSLNYDGSAPSLASSDPKISADARQLAFVSSATGLAPGGDTNGVPDAFIRDRRTGATFRVNVSSGWNQANAAASDVRISPAGTDVAFASAATNLVSGDTNAVADVFARSPLHAIPSSLIGTELTLLPVGAQKVVALTFDCGGNADGVASILATLAATGTAATFFMTGRWTEVYPGQAATIAESYPVGNHTYSHPYLTQLTDAQVRTEVIRGRDAILTATGLDPHPMFRFPFGDSDARTIRLLNGLGYAGIRWSIDTLGWEGTSGGQSVGSVVQRVLDHLQPGAIVLMHVGSNPDDGSTLDADALPTIIADLVARGYTFTTIDRFA